MTEGKPISAAERRLRVARVNFDGATNRLRAAQNDLADAEHLWEEATRELEAAEDALSAQGKRQTAVRL